APDLGAIHPRKANMGTRRSSDGPREAPSVAMEHGQRPEKGTRRVQPGVEYHRHRLQERASMVIHHALWSAGGSACVVDREKRAFVNRGDLEWCRRLYQRLYLGKHDQTATFIRQGLRIAASPFELSVAQK